MTRSKQATKQAILEAAETVLKQHGAQDTTMDAVAKSAGCAKGLLHYHFKTKPQLLAEAVTRLSAAREASWKVAFDTSEPQEAISRTWRAIAEEAESGALRAWTSLITLTDSQIDRAVKASAESFRDQLTSSTEALLGRAGFKATIPIEQLGWLLAAVVQGMSFHLAAGGDVETLEDAYAAAWLGILSLSEPA